MLRIVRFTLLGAIATVAFSGLVGMDTVLPDAVAALVGGGVTGMLAKFSVLA